MPERGRCFSMGWTTLSGPVCSEGGKVGDSRKKFSERERRAKERVRLLRARGSAELKKVASSSAMQGLWLKNRKVRSQISGVDRSRFHGRRKFREVRRGGR